MRVQKYDKFLFPPNFTARKYEKGARRWIIRGCRALRGLVLRAFYNRWKIIHAAGEPGKEVVHEVKVRVRKAAICPPLRGYAHKKLRGRTTELMRE